MDFEAVVVEKELEPVHQIAQRKVEQLFSELWRQVSPKLVLLKAAQHRELLNTAHERDGFVVQAVGNHCFSLFVDAEQSLLDVKLFFSDHFLDRLEALLREDLQFDDGEAEQSEELGHHHGYHRPCAFSEGIDVTIAHRGHRRGNIVGGVGVVLGVVFGVCAQGVHPLAISGTHVKPQTSEQVDQQHEHAGCPDVAHNILDLEALLHKVVLQNLLHKAERLGDSRQHQELEELEPYKKIVGPVLDLDLLIGFVRHQSMTQLVDEHGNAGKTVEEEVAGVFARNHRKSLL